MKRDQTEKVDVSRLRLMENDDRRTFEQMIRKDIKEEKLPQIKECDNKEKDYETQVKMMKYRNRRPSNWH